MKRALQVVVLVAMVVLAGCSPTISGHVGTDRLNIGGSATYVPPVGVFLEADATVNPFGVFGETPINNDTQELFELIVDPIDGVTVGASLDWLMPASFQAEAGAQADPYKLLSLGLEWLTNSILGD